MLLSSKEKLLGFFNKKGVIIGVGDLVEVEFFSSVGSRRLRKFRGVCILCRVELYGGFFFTLRRIVDGVGVELSLFSDSGNIISLVCVERGYVRGVSSKLYRLRERRLRIKNN